MYWDDVRDVRGDCHTVLTDILKKYGARIFQSAYIWFAQRPNAMWSSHTKRNYAAANPFSYLSNATDFLKYNVDDEDGEWLPQTEVSLLPRAGRAEITADPGKKGNVIKNSTFDDFTQTGGVMQYWTYNGAFTEADGYIDLG
ncbi:unnamed protein product, partial [marine sediment metagenome]